MTPGRKRGQGMVWVRGHASRDEDVAGLRQAAGLARRLHGKRRAAGHIRQAHGVPGKAEPLKVIEVH